MSGKGAPDCSEALSLQWLSSILHPTNINHCKLSPIYNGCIVAPYNGSGTPSAEKYLGFGKKSATPTVNTPQK